MMFWQCFVLYSVLYCISVQLQLFSQIIFIRPEKYDFAEIDLSCGTRQYVTLHIYLLCQNVSSDVHKGARFVGNWSISKLTTVLILSKIPGYPYVKLKLWPGCPFVRLLSLL
jgi:hypothetical protein